MKEQSADYADYTDLTRKMRDEKTYKIIGSAMEVHKEPRCGFLEAMFQEALERELTTQGIPFKSQPIVEIKYKGEPLEKKYQPDFICYDEVIVEIKTTGILTSLEETQVINYFKATGLKVGLLINLGSKSLEHKRLVYNL